MTRSARRSNLMNATPHRVETTDYQCSECGGELLHHGISYICTACGIIQDRPTKSKSQDPLDAIQTMWNAKGGGVISARCDECEVEFDHEFKTKDQQALALERMRDKLKHHLESHIFRK